jgi:hypothetical protein
MVQFALPIFMPSAAWQEHRILMTLPRARHRYFY